MVRDHFIDPRVASQFLIAGIGNVVALGPVTDCVQVDVDEGDAAFAAIAKTPTASRIEG